MFDFTDKVVVVTGASGIGIGNEIAKRFYNAGAFLGICSFSSERILLAAEEIAANDQKRMFSMCADMSKVKDISAFLQGVVDKYGRIDVLINNVGIQFPKASTEVTERDWDATIDTNMKGYFFSSQYAAKIMIEAGGGSIINIGSVNAVTVVVGQAVYATTKAGISQMTKSLAREWAPHGIRVNCIGPGSIPTLINRDIYKDPAVEVAMCEKIPMGRRGTTTEIADVAMFLASDYSSYITGQTIFVDGGLTLVHG